MKFFVLALFLCVAISSVVSVTVTVNEHNFAPSAAVTELTNIVKSVYETYSTTEQRLHYLSTTLTDELLSLTRLPTFWHTIASNDDSYTPTDVYYAKIRIVDGLFARYVTVFSN